MAAAKTLIITGASGFLGSHLARKFVDDGWAVILLTRHTSRLSRVADILDRVRIIDVNRLSELFAALQDVHAVIHTATNYGRRGDLASDILDANGLFPLRLFEGLVRHGSGAFINTDTVLDPMFNAYALSKHQFKQWGKLLALTGGMRFINLRLEHVYGAGDDPAKFTTHVIRGCLGREPELKLTPGEQKRDFIHIEDVVDAYVKVIERIPDLSLDFEEFDVGSGQAVTIREFVEIVHRLTGAITRLSFGAIPYRLDEPMFSQANTSRLKALGWNTRYDLSKGLAQAIESERFISVGRNRGQT